MTEDFHPTGRRSVLKNFDDGGLTSGSRDIHVYVPRGYDASTARYPVLYINDGQSALRGIWDGPCLDYDETHDRLCDDGLIQPAILVAINFNREGRIRDLTPAEDNGGNLDGYYRFIVERVKPYIDQHYRTRPEPAATAIVGISMGGLAAFLLAYYHPETFGMAACLSPSLWHGNRCAIRMLQEDTGARKSVRFWLDAGGGEYDAWTDVACVYKRLEQWGWRPGDELAAYFDYTGAHVMASWRNRIQHVLYFLLHKDPLQFLEYRLVSAVDPTAPVMDLRSGQRRIIGAEAWYANDLRLNVPQPQLTVDHTKVVTLDANDPLLLNVAGAGETTIRSTYLGHEAALRVIGYDPGAAPPYLPCPHAESFPLFHPVVDEEDRTVCHFEVLYDEQHLHIALDVIDSAPVSDPAISPRNQDSVWVCLDARPEPILCRGAGYDNTERFLNVVVSPSAVGEPVHFCSSDKALDWLPFLPEGTRMSSALTPSGYHVTLSIPHRYLDEMQGGPWRVFRLNVCVNKGDRPGGPIRRTWWQPEWHLFLSPVAAGIFARLSGP